MKIIIFWFRIVSSIPINNEPVLVYIVVSLVSQFYPLNIAHHVLIDAGCWLDAATKCSNRLMVVSILLQHHLNHA